MIQELEGKCVPVHYDARNDHRSGWRVEEEGSVPCDAVGILHRRGGRQEMLVYWGWRGDQSTRHGPGQGGGVSAAAVSEADVVRVISSVMRVS